MKEPKKTLYEFVREEFDKEIARKTGWGKNEIMQAFDRSFTKGIIKYADCMGVDLT